MKENLQKHLHLALILLSLALVLVAGAWFVHHNQRVMEANIRSLLDERQLALKSLAEVTDSNGADGVVESIIEDCPRREQFESLLDNLSTLGARDLIAVQSLSESCGSFYAERKALMVAKFEIELTQYSELIGLLSILTKNDIETYALASWQKILELEKARSTILRDQVDIQNDIISALVLGESVQSAHVAELVRQAQEMNELLKVYDKQLDEMREARAE